MSFSPRFPGPSFHLGLALNFSVFNNQQGLGTVGYSQVPLLF